MQTYVVQPGESPAAIAIKFAGCPKCAIDLVRANPHKEVVVFPNGFTTFRDLAAGEALNLPDKWFDGSMDALPKSYFASLPHADGTTLGALAAAPTISGPLLAAAQSAAAAIAADPGYCTSVAKPGSSVNAAVHAFKLAWNASQASKVPIGTSSYEAATAAALRDVLGAAPAACGGAPLVVVPAAAKKEEGLSTAAIATIGLLGAGAIGGLLYWVTRKYPDALSIKVNRTCPMPRTRPEYARGTDWVWNFDECFWEKIEPPRKP